MVGPNKRKKSRLNSHESVLHTAEPHAAHPHDQTAAPANSTSTSQQPQPVRTASTSASASAERPSSWLSPSTWKSKASSTAEIARENVSVAQGATSESSLADQAACRQSVSKSMRGVRKSAPVLAEPTRVHATSDTPHRPERHSNSLSTPEQPEKRGHKGQKSIQADRETRSLGDQAPFPPTPSAGSEAGDAKSVSSSVTRPHSGRWFGWWSRPDGYGSDGEGMKEQQQQQNKRQKLDTDDARNTPLPVSPTPAPKFGMAAEGLKGDGAGQSNTGDLSGATTTAQWEGIQNQTDTPSSARSWFGLWSKAQYQQAHEEHARGAEKLAASDNPDTAPEGIDTPSKTPVSVSSDKEPDQLSKASGWAFWLADKPKDAAPSSPGDTKKRVGELAVADTPSQSHPEVAQFNEERATKQTVKKQPSKRTGSLLRPKKEEQDESKDATTEGEPTLSSPPTQSEAPIDSLPPAPVQRGKMPQLRPNLILPTLDDTFPAAPNPGYISRLTTYLAQTLHLPGSASPLPPQHIYLTPPPKVRKAIAIGVHGYFPAPMLQRVLGQPTGTSIRFANYAATSIRAWCKERQPDLEDIEVETVALEGEGYVADRVSTLWKLLLNWLSHLRQADFILLACHSQGVPVTIMLVSKLIQLHCLSPNVRIGICAMAGINLGPFPEYKSRLIGGSALELFDFGNPKSKVSKAYVEALDVCLRHGVRVTFVGSLDDQLVSLESSLHAPLSHPYVNRAVFIDGRLHAPNFLIHLVVFAVKLRNLGISDHGLIRELSGPLGGSLVGGEGHSRVYDDPAVYRMAIEFALQSTDMSQTLLPPATAASSLLAADKNKAREVASARRASLAGYPQTAAVANGIRRGSFSSSTNLPGIAPIFAVYEPAQPGNTSNPFYLPWAVRGMLEESVVKRESKMRAEVEELVKEFEDWRPTSKVLKDVRWRLEGVRSML